MLPLMILKTTCDAISPRYPFDRLIIAQIKAEDLTLISRDRR